MKNTSSILLIGLVAVCPSFCLAQPTPPNVVLEPDVHEQSETAIALHPTNHNIQLATWNDFRASPNNHPEPGYGVSTNGGVTWMRGLLTLPARPPGQPPIVRGFDPSCAINRGGVYFYCYAVKNNATPPRWNIAVSKTTTPNSPDWQDNVISDPVTDYAVHDKPFLAIDNTGGDRDGFLYASWSGALDENYNVDRIYFSRSEDGGNTWTNPTEISSRARMVMPGGL